MLCFIATPAFAQRELTDIPDPDPAKELASFKLAEGFEANLFASEPMVVNPIHMNWDARGRLWIATSPIYPHIKPGQKADDKILILEDTDGDGKADKSTVFAEGLLIPTAVLPTPSCNAAYVANSTEMLYMEDTDGDGKADKTTVLLSGFGTEDTHHILHTFRYGPDGAFYFNQSIYIHSHIETPWGVKRLSGSGIWRFRPETMKLEVMMRGLVNPWGHAFTDYGNSFATDGAGVEGINYVFPGAAFTSAVGVSRIMRGLNPGQPKHCGLEVVTGRHFPAEWQGNLIANDFRGNRINRFALEEEGSGFVSRQLPDLLTSSHMAFRPVDVKMGPDGALYVADWYNPIIQHGEVDFHDPRRDRKRGRIWRITAKGRALIATPPVVEATVPQLLEMLRLPEQATREHAKMQMQARGAEAVKPELDKWVADLRKQAEPAGHALLEALWSYQSIGVVEPELLKSLLRSSDPRVRAASVRVLAEWHAKLNDTMEWLGAAVTDAHPLVRLEAVCTLRAVGTPQAAELAARVLDTEIDGNTDYALWVTMRELAPRWLPEFQAGRLTFGGHTSHVAFALRAIENPAALAPLVNLYQQGQVEAKDRPATIALLGDLGDAQALRVIYDSALRSDENRAHILQSLVKAVQQRRARPMGDLSSIIQLLSLDDADVRAAAALLAGVWQVDAAKTPLVQIAGDPQTSFAVRFAAVRGLAGYGAGAMDAFKTLLADGQPTAVKSAALSGLVSVDVHAAASLTPTVLAQLDEVLASPVFDSFLSHREGPKVLAEALQEARLPEAVAALGLRKAGSSGVDVKQLSEALMKAGGLQPMVQQLTPQQMAAMVKDVNEKGDGHRGEAVYRRVALQCMVCHAIAGGGGKVGPDLVSLGASAPLDYIIESLLEPSAKIKEGYHMTVVTTKDGNVISGGLMKESDRELVLRDAADKPVTIPTANIQSKTIVPVSLMPPGLTASLRRDEFVDLVKFLALLGKEGDFKAPTQRYVRNWLALQGSPEIGWQFLRHGMDIVTGSDPSLPWLNVAATVQGVLPIADTPPSKSPVSGLFTVARFSLDVSTAGKIGLKFNEAKGLQLWHERTPVVLGQVTAIELPVGRHNFTVSRNLAEIQAPFQVEVIDVEGSPGRAQPVQ